MLKKNLLVALIAGSVACTLQPVYADVNLRIDPINMIIGSYKADLEIELSQGYTLSPTFTYHESGNFIFRDREGFALGLRANKYFSNTAYKGIFVSGELRYVDMETSSSHLFRPQTTGDATGFEMDLMVGYSWLWESFNMSLAGGVLLNTFGEIEEKDASGDFVHINDEFEDPEAKIEYSLGWVF
ncbi:MAG: hypothetical protein COA42_21150 [Alteromonadaceae bacterium]|nr:MAG: hypothetical protein COA42_21150 [Alteromonadaceae bacterium]